MAPRPAVEYQKGPENTAHRLNDRAKYDLLTVHTIISASPILHVSFPDPSSPFPAALPMIGTMASFNRPSAGLDEPLDLYLHGYISSRLMQAPVKAAAAAGVDGDGKPSEEYKGLPLTISAAHCDGLVLSLTPNSHSYNYRSAILFGYALPVTDPAEKLWAMERVTNSVVPGRWRDDRVRLPPTKAEMTSTQILRVRIESASAKVREGGPHDDKADLGDEEVKGRCWTGVVPVWQCFGEPVASGSNQVEVPGYLREYIDGSNAETKDSAERKAVEPGSGK